MNLPELILLGFIPLYLFRKIKLLINYLFYTYLKENKVWPDKCLESWNYLSKK